MTIPIKPFLISTPRTGSNLFSHMLYLLAKKNWNCQTDLNEYFRPEQFQKNGVTHNIRLPHYYCVINNQIERRYDCDQNRSQIPYNKRLEILSQLPEVHLIKAHSFHLNDEIISYLINRNYTIFFIHRHDKLSQFLSFLIAEHNNKWIYKKNDPESHKMIYSRKLLNRFVKYLELFYELKSSLNGYSVVYEDFIKNGGDQQSILTLTGLTAEINTEQNWTFVPSKYYDHPENLIMNRVEWENDKPFVVKELSRFNDTFQKT